MKIITIAGTHSKVGKTRLAEILLGRLRGWSALKVTVVHQGRCPRNKNCQACTELDSNFSIINHKKIIEEKGKDTQRLKEAGAKDVLWLRARPEGLRQGLRQALTKFKKARGLIIEGTSPLKYLKPDIAIMVKDQYQMKDTALEIMDKVDFSVSLSALCHCEPAEGMAKQSHPDPSLCSGLNSTNKLMFHKFWSHLT